MNLHQCRSMHAAASRGGCNKPVFVLFCCAILALDQASFSLPSFHILYYAV